MVRKLAKKSTSRQKRSVHELADAGGNGRIVDVTVVVLKDGYASTAIAPIEIFHSAGVVGIGSMAKRYIRGSGCGLRRSMDGK